MAFVLDCSVTMDPVSRSRTWGATLDLAHVHRISVYDAMYLELARRLPLPLATLDAELRAAARSADVDVLPPR